QDLLLNVLVAGFRVDAVVAQQLKSATNSEFLFLSPPATLVSTLNPRATGALAQDIARKRGHEKVSDGLIEYAAFDNPLKDIAGKPVGKLVILRSFEDGRKRIAGLYTNIILLWLVAVTAGGGVAHLFGGGGGGAGGGGGVGGGGGGRGGRREGRGGG